MIANVVIDGTSGSPESERGLQRTVQIFESLGQPAQQQAKLPPEETSCQEARIDPDGGDDEEGTCKLGQQTLTIVNADGKVETPGKEVSRLRVKTGDVLTSPLRGRTRTRGGFVVVTFRLENTGNEPLNAFRPNLVVDGKRYRYNDEPNKEAFLQSDTPFLIQPGAFETVLLLFDLRPSRPAGQSAAGPSRSPRTGRLRTSRPASSASASRDRVPRRRRRARYAEPAAGGEEDARPARRAELHRRERRGDPVRRLGPDPLLDQGLLACRADVDA